MRNMLRAWCESKSKHRLREIGIFLWLWWKLFTVLMCARYFSVLYYWHSDTIMIVCGARPTQTHFDVILVPLHVHLSENCSQHSRVVLSRGERHDGTRLKVNCKKLWSRMGELTGLLQFFHRKILRRPGMIKLFLNLHFSSCFSPEIIVCLVDVAASIFHRNESENSWLMKKSFI